MSNRFKTAFVLPVFLIVIFVLAYLLNIQNKFGSLDLNDKSYKIEIADDDKERLRGLSGRNEIGSEGMLFVFPNSDKHGIWMKDMKFPIDILWLDTEFNVVHVVENADPNSYPYIFYPNSPAKYVFEVKSGWIDKNQIEVGSQLHFSL